MKTGSKINILYKKLCGIELYISILCLTGSVCVIFISAVMRTVRMPINWGIDIALLLFTWSTFLGADIAYRNHQTVMVDIFINILPAAISIFLRIFCYILSLIFMAAMVYYGILLCRRSAARSFQGIPGFSYSWVIASIPVSFSLMMITACRRLYYELTKNTGKPDAEITAQEKI